MSRTPTITKRLMRSEIMVTPESTNKLKSPLRKRIKSSSIKDQTNLATPSTSRQMHQHSAEKAIAWNVDDAVAFLCAKDARFQSCYEKWGLGPYAETTSDAGITVHDPFRALATAILGQQISWKVARIIVHKFKRLFYADLPETLPPITSITTGVPIPQAVDPALDVFPSPDMVLEMPVEILRTAGLSARKAEYILDLARHFASGLLTADFLAHASDAEIFEALIKVRGIGAWSVDMFLMFQSKRSDVLPTGDLGIQVGLLKFMTGQAPYLGLSDKVLKRPPQKTKAGLYLTPAEMEEYMADWRPYRSLVCWWMYRITEYKSENPVF